MGNKYRFVVMAVIKYYERFIGLQNAVYEEIYSTSTPGRLISRCEAMEIIEKQGLIPCFESSDGIVWDTPDMEFRKRNS